MAKSRRVDVEVAGKTYRVPKEDAVLERLVHEAHQAKIVADFADKVFKTKRDALVLLAMERRGKSSTVNLGSIDLVAKVRFGQTIGFDSQTLTTVRDANPEEFEQIFSETTSFKPRKNLELWLKEPGHKAIADVIQSAMTVTDNAPKLAFEPITDAS